MVYFRNRRDAGKQLCPLLEQYQGKDVIVYALPRGGVPIAAEIAAFLHAPLDLLFAHKISHPDQPEYAVAAVSESGHLIGSPEELSTLHPTWLEQEKHHQLKEMERKRNLYLKGKKDHPLKGKIAILVDDGIATGLTVLVGIEELKDRLPKQIVVAVPVAPESTANLIRSRVDALISVEIPEDGDFLGAVGAYYQTFNQVEDSEVIALLHRFQNNDHQNLQGPE